MLLLPQDELAKSSAPLSALVERHLGRGSSRALAMFVVVSGLGALNGWTLLSGEVTRSMAAQRALPAWLARTNRYDAAAAALAANGALASAMVLMSYSKSLVQEFTFLTNVVTGAALPLYLCCSLALFVAWRRGAGGVALLSLAIAGALYSIFAFVGMGREPSWLAVLLTMAGLPLYFALRRRI
jgi:APA family basic amino acid/polyamine antiporter